MRFAASLVPRKFIQGREKKQKQTFLLQLMVSSKQLKNNNYQQDSESGLNQDWQLVSAPETLCRVCFN